MPNFNKAITAKAVAEDKRLTFLPKFFGEKLMMYGEQLVYTWAQRLSPDYDGGLWNFFHLSNGSGYVAPATDKRFNCEVMGNGYSGEVSADAFGVIVTMFALNGLIAEVAGRGHGCDPLIDRYYLLREFACAHPDAGAILRAID